MRLFIIGMLTSIMVSGAVNIGLGYVHNPNGHNTTFFTNQRVALVLVMYLSDE